MRGRLPPDTAAERRGYTESGHACLCSRPAVQPASAARFGRGRARRESTAPTMPHVPPGGPGPMPSPAPIRPAWGARDRSAGAVGVGPSLRWPVGLPRWRLCGLPQQAGCRPGSPRLRSQWLADRTPMLTLFQDGFDERGPVPPEKRFLIILKGLRPSSTWLAMYQETGATWLYQGQRVWWL